MKKYLLINQSEDLQYYIEKGIHAFIFGVDCLNAIGINKIDFKVMKEMLNRCFENQCDVILYFNALIPQSDLQVAKETFLWCEQNRKLFESIAVSDYCFMTFNQQLDKPLPLIYAPDTLVTNCRDCDLFLQLGYQKYWLANELSIAEIETMLNHNQDKGLLQVFGYLKTSNSRRHLLTNYCHVIDSNHDVVNNSHLTLVEETRKFKMPIIENNNGTTIFADFVLYDPSRYDALMNAYGWIYSSLFIDKQDVVKAYFNQEIDNHKYRLDSTYWESETSIVKEGNNE